MSQDETAAAHLTVDDLATMSLEARERVLSDAESALDCGGGALWLCFGCGRLVGAVVVVGEDYLGVTCCSRPGPGSST